MQAQGIIPSGPDRGTPEIIDISSVEDHSEEPSQITQHEVAHSSAETRQEESGTQSRRMNATSGPSNMTGLSTSDPATVTAKEEMDDIKPSAHDSDSDGDYAELTVPDLHLIE